MRLVKNTPNGLIEVLETVDSDYPGIVVYLNGVHVITFESDMETNQMNLYTYTDIRNDDYTDKIMFKGGE